MFKWFRGDETQVDLCGGGVSSAFCPDGKLASRSAAAAARYHVASIIIIIIIISIFFFFFIHHKKQKDKKLKSFLHVKLSVWSFKEKTV